MADGDQPNSQGDAPQAPQGILHEVIAPDGTRGTASSADLQGLPSDYKVTGRLRMYAPDGTRGYADPQHLADLSKAGYRLTPETQFEQERNPQSQPGFLQSAANVIENQVKGVPRMLAQPLAEASDAYKAQRAAGAGRLSSGAEAVLTAILNPEMHEALDAFGTAKRVQEGRSVPYAVLAPPVAEAVGVNLPAMEHAADIGNKKGILAEAAVPAAEAAAATAAHAAVSGAKGEAVRAKTSEAIARPTIDRTLRQTKITEDYGHSPERAIVKENISTAAQAKAKLDEVGKQIDDTLNKPEHVAKTIDVKSIVLRNARGAIAEAKRAGNPGAVKRITEVRDAMLNSYGNLNKAPRAAAAMKSKIYGDVKWTGAEHDNEVNGFRKSVAAGIRDKINEAAPEVKQLNQRYGDIAAAKEGLERGEMRRANKGIVSRAREGAVAQGTRKVAQLIGKQYPKRGPGMTRGATPQKPGPGMTKPGTAIVPRGEQGIDQFFKGKKQLPQ